MCVFMFSIKEIQIGQKPEEINIVYPVLFRNTLYIVRYIQSEQRKFNNYFKIKRIIHIILYEAYIL